MIKILLSLHLAAASVVLSVWLINLRSLIINYEETSIEKYHHHHWLSSEIRREIVSPPRCFSFYFKQQSIISYLKPFWKGLKKDEFLFLILRHFIYFPKEIKCSGESVHKSFVNYFLLLFLFLIWSYQIADCTTGPTKVWLCGPDVSGLSSTNSAPIPARWDQTCE